MLGDAPSRAPRRPPEASRLLRASVKTYASRSPVSRRADVIVDPQRPPSDTSFGEQIEIVQSRQSKLVSVVTPVYNGARYLAECIESVLAQTYDELEYVICENHGTDETPAIVARYARADARIRVVSPERFLPQIANWNFAVRQISAASAYEKFVHADDTIAPT